MLVTVMTTDGGPHSAEKWAVTTAGAIIKIGADASGRNESEARKLELAIIDALEDAHGDVQAHERWKIAEHGHERLSHALDPSPHVDGPFEAILALGLASAWAEHFAKPETQAGIRNVLANHFASSMHIERKWHADGMVIGDDHKPTPNPAHDPNNEHLVAFQAKGA